MPGNFALFQAQIRSDMPVLARQRRRERVPDLDAAVGTGHEEQARLPLRAVLDKGREGQRGIDGRGNV
jgi:hypothetical protein